MSTWKVNTLVIDMTGTLTEGKPKVIRVAFWGALAMAVTAGIGAIFGAHV